MKKIGIKISELESVSAVAAHGFSVTQTASLLHATQSGISRHVIDVEDMLGVAIFERQKNRLVGLTPAGDALLPLVNRLLDQAQDLQRVAAAFADGRRGSLCVATSQTHARYLLPRVIERFLREYPQVELRLRHGHLAQIASWLESGDADISVSAALPGTAGADLLLYPYGELYRIVVVPDGHPLAKRPHPTLDDIAAFPIITYEPHFAAHVQIMDAFRSAGLHPKIALTTGDTDIMKTYARCGLGVAIVADPAFDPAIDYNLSAIDARHLFPPATMYLGIKKARPLSTHALKFIDFIAPELRSTISPATV